MPIDLLPMNFFARSIWFGLLSWVLCSAAWAAPVDVAGRGALELGPHAAYWFDPSHRADWTQVLHQDRTGAFRPLGRRQGNFGYRADPVWYRFTLSNPTTRPLTRFLRTGLRDQDSQLLRLSADSQRVQKLVPWDQPSIWQFYRLSLPPGEAVRFYLRINRQDHNIQASYLKLLDLSALLKYQERQTHLSLFVYGALFSLALYFCFQFHALRTPSSLFFVGMLLAESVGLAALDGVGMHYLWPPTANGMVAQIGSFSLGLFFTLLVQNLLETARQLPRVHRMLQLQVFGLLGLLMLSLLPFPAWVNQAQALLGALVPFVLLVALLAARRSQRRPVHRLLAGWGLYFLALSVLMVFVFGAPHIDLTQEEMLWAVKLAVLSSMLTIASILSDQVQRLNEEKIQAQTELTDQARETAQRLEREVSLRTLELDEMVEKLRRLNQEKNHFLTLAAHDLKTPLANIGLFAELIAQQLPKAVGRSGEYLSYIHKSSAEMQRLIAELLDADRIEEQSTSPHVQPTPLVSIVQRTVDAFAPTAQAHGLRLEASLPPYPATILTQPNWVQLALSNLLSNALKFAPQGSTIQVAVEAREENWCLSVTDQGPGIAAAEQEKLFEPFTQVDARHEGDFQSTGLGLYLVRRLQERSGGSVEVRSAPGQGTRFTLTYRQAPEETAPWESTAPNEGEPVFWETDSARKD